MLSGSIGTTVAIAVALSVAVASAQAPSKGGDHGAPAKAPPAVKANDKHTAPPSAPAAPEMQLPPGMTMEDMKAFMDAATPGPMHKHLMEGVGTWAGKTKSWSEPGSSPVESTCVSTIVPLLDGKFVQCEVKGDMPGMGPFHGMGLNGYDNVSKQFQSSWIDNMGTGMMQGTGTLSSDGKVLTWNYNFYCPLQKKACVMREVETITGPNTMTLEMFGPHPKTGQEFKMMEIAFTRTPDAAGKATATGSER